MGSRDNIDARGIVYAHCLISVKVLRKQGYKRYAKTLYKPERTKEANEKIKQFTQDPLPHFFKYAKDKKDSQILDVNDSFVNKLESLISNPRLTFKKLGFEDIDYTLMMSNPYIEFDVEFADNGRLIKEESDPLLVKYCEFNKEYYLTVDNALCPDKDNSTDTYAKTKAKYNKISNEVKYALSQFGYSDEEIVDILVKYLYGIKKSKNKAALWLCYGDIIVENLKKHLRLFTKVIQCVDCGKWISIDINDSATIRCTVCQRDHKKEIDREWHRKQTGGFTDIRKSIEMYCYDEFIMGFDSIEECCKHLAENVNKGTKNLKSIRKGIERAIKDGGQYKGFNFVKC